MGKKKRRAGPLLSERLLRDLPAPVRARALTLAQRDPPDLVFEAILLACDPNWDPHGTLPAPRKPFRAKRPLEWASSRRDRSSLSSLRSVPRTITKARASRVVSACDGPRRSSASFDTPTIPSRPGRSRHAPSSAYSPLLGRPRSSTSAAGDSDSTVPVPSPMWRSPRLTVPRASPTTFAKAGPPGSSLHHQQHRSLTLPTNRRGTPGPADSTHMFPLDLPSPKVSPFAQFVKKSPSFPVLPSPCYPRTPFSLTSPGPGLLGKSMRSPLLGVSGVGFSSLSTPALGSSWTPALGSSLTSLGLGANSARLSLGSAPHHAQSHHHHSSAMPSIHLGPAATSPPPQLPQARPGSTSTRETLLHAGSSMSTATSSSMGAKPAGQLSDLVLLAAAGPRLGGSSSRRSQHQQHHSAAVTPSPSTATSSPATPSAAFLNVLASPRPKVSSFGSSSAEAPPALAELERAGAGVTHSVAGARPAPMTPDEYGAVTALSRMKRSPGPRFLSTPGTTVVSSQ